METFFKKIQIIFNLIYDFLILYYFKKNKNYKVIFGYSLRDIDYTRKEIIVIENNKNSNAAPKFLFRWKKEEIKNYLLYYQYNKNFENVEKVIRKEIFNGQYCKKYQYIGKSDLRFKMVNKLNKCELTENIQKIKIQPNIFSLNTENKGVEIFSFDLINN